ncbi:MAG: anthranilate synthase component I family protein [Cryobacterium sp.]
MRAPVQHQRLHDWWDPAVVFDTLYRDARYAFWLDAGPGTGTGFSYLGAARTGSRLVTASVPHGTVTVSRPVDDPGTAVTTAGSIFDFLRADLADQNLPATPAPPGEFLLGWVGWLGYELGSVPVGTPAHPSRYADATLIDVDRLLVFDHAARTVTLVSDPDTAGPIAPWARLVERALAAPPPAPHPGETGAAPRLDEDSVAPARWRHSAQVYADLIHRCQAVIRRGDAYQLCLTNEILVDGAYDDDRVYTRLREGSPTHHGGLLRFGDVSVLSASPELFLTISADGRVSTKPIKGTRARSPDPLHDEQLRRDLVTSEKERAENLMIVDLMRNDLGRIAALGSVRVRDLLRVESYPAVHQLVSTVEARVARGLSAVDVVETCFPAGSMTGAPKRSAMTELCALEAGPRGVYSGAFGFLSRTGAVDLAMVIRSIVLTPVQAAIGTGGGITALSDPQDEIEETRLKAAALLLALGRPGRPQGTVETLDRPVPANLEQWPTPTGASA